MKRAFFPTAVLAFAIAAPAADFKGWISDATCGAGNAGSNLKGKVQITGEVKGDTIHIAKIIDIKD
jgi:hypothetical protein